MPPTARGVFHQSLPRVERYARWLAADGVLRGLIGPREAPRLWERHLMNCAVLAEAVPTGAEVADLGSGAGLPGVVLGLVRPDLRITLVEPLLRRTTFLDEVVADLALDRVRVLRGRAEELHGTEDFDVVTARALAPLGRLLDWSMPLVREGGVLLAMKGSSAETEVRDAAGQLRRHGAGRVEVLSLGSNELDRAATVVRVEAGRPSRLGWDAARRDRTDRRTDSRAGRRKGRRS